MPPVCAGGVLSPARAALAERPEDVLDEPVELRRQRAVGRGVLAEEEQIRAPLVRLLGRRVGSGVHCVLKVVHVPPARSGWTELGPVFRDWNGRRRWRLGACLELSLLLGQLGRASCDLPLADCELARPVGELALAI